MNEDISSGHSRSRSRYRSSLSGRPTFGHDFQTHIGVCMWRWALINRSAKIAPLVNKAAKGAPRSSEFLRRLYREFWNFLHWTYSGL
ncbi:unnamed protein product, partial [Iphiclides podalirius]